MIKIIIPIITALICSLHAGAQSIIYNEGSLITELNVAGEADAYPWISADGLRLYYSKHFNGGISHIGYAVRDDINSPFLLMDTYLAGSTVDGSSCWLTPDELTIYFSVDGALSKATRTAIGQQFGPPVSITLSGVAGITARSPSLTPDGTQLYIRDFSTLGFRKFTSTGTDSFTFDSMLETGLTQLGTGKLDHTGLAYYFSSDMGNGHRIFRMSRNALTDDLSNVQELSGSAFTAGYSWMQPMVAADETIMVLVRTQTDWQQNDLFLALGDLTVGLPLHWQDRLTCWPNPATDQLNVLLPGGSANAGTRSLIMDMNGRLVHSSATQDLGTVRLDVSALPAGTYILSTEGNGLRHRTHFMIAR